MRRSKPEAESKIVLPITPMLDMTFQLLFFFIVNFNPRPQEGVLDMALPMEEEKQAHKQADANPKGNDKEDLDLKADVTVKVRTQLDKENMGTISALSIRNNEGKEDPIVPREQAKEDEKPAERERRLLNALKEDLAKRRETLSNKDGIKVQGDGMLRVHSIMKVVDTCRKSGFSNTSFVQPDGFER